MAARPWRPPSAPRGAITDVASGGGEWRYLAAGAASAALLPTLALGIHAPLWAAVAGAATAFGGLVLVLSPRRPLEDFNPGKIGSGRVAVARAALEEALPALSRLEAAAGRIKDADVRGRVTAIARAGRNVVAELEKTPESLSSVQRLLTYYSPRAAELAEGYVAMEARGVGAERRAAIADLLVKLQDAFAHYRDQLADQELKTLDIDIRLVGQALEEDIGEPIRTPAPDLGRTADPAGRRGSP